MSLRTLPLLCLLALGACTRPVSMESAWQPGSRPASPFGSILVVAVSEDFNRRRLFENAVVDELARTGTRATPSTRTMLTTDALNRDSVTALVRQTGAEAVLVTRLVNQDVDVSQQRGRAVAKLGTPDARIAGVDPYGYDFYTYDFSVTWEPSTLVINRNVKLTTDLFATAGGQMLYSVRSDVRITNSASLDQNSDVGVIDAVAGALVRRLRLDGAVR